MTIEPISAHEQSPAHPASRGHSEVVVWPGVFVRKLVRRAALGTFHFILTCRLGSDEEGAMGRRWTDQDIEDLKRMAQYCSAPKIAELTNRTAGGVVSKAYQLRLSLRSSRHANEQAIVADPAGIEQADLGGEATDHREWNPRSIQHRIYATPERIADFSCFSGELCHLRLIVD